jgi:predicted DNA binding protein
MARDKTTLEIDSSYDLKDFNHAIRYYCTFSKSQQTIEKTMELNQLKIAEQSIAARVWYKVRSYVSFGDNPQQFNLME